ncbi:GDP-mannose 4,6-dehydratase [Oricola cellulosilytica]|uniref:NAD-dependent epimerase/dehydratase family protein n=1 Tax=Oricola cellulosilytica TaxID=1429082 RepID=A0A4R0P722_9HYPH|nr:GDP-mannose 4,6-dehydratase [Oricola cellulosilytica]TCD11302.1 NAD-dependent epimerase/dehydratase family protein [Oricola cellulosilytica]
MAQTRVLITGAAGFVGPYVAHALRCMFGSDIDLLLTAKVEVGGTEALDVTDQKSVNDIVARYQPTHVVHLAGIAVPSVVASSPEVAWRVHLDGTLNVAGAILANAPDCCLINVGTGLIYGASAKTGLPLNEHTLLAPLDDYGATKAAADLALGALAQRGLKCIRMRPFNHIGPGQSQDFVAPAFATQIARIEAGLAEPVIRVGNLAVERDFLDVRDVAAAYALAVAKSAMVVPGTILNVASGEGRPISEVLNILLSRSSATIRVEQDSSRVRPSDLPRIVGDAGKARNLLSWEPKQQLEQTLTDVLVYCRTRLATH